MTTSPSIQLRVVDDADTALKLLAEGWCPIEASIGGRTFVDDLLMDHHGKFSHLEAVASRAYRDHYGARREDPRFFTPSPVDADAAWATAALAGLLPHPDAVVPEGTPSHIAGSLTRDWSALAATISLVDVEPIGLDVPDLDCGEMLLTWGALVGGASLRANEFARIVEEAARAADR